MLARRQRSVMLLAAVLAFVLSVGSGLVAAGPVDASTQRALLRAALDMAISSPPANLVRAAITPDYNRGSDGRVTVLLLGSDYRPTLSGERTDIIIVMTINPSTRQMAAVSIPRDVARLPIGPGRTFKGKINSMFAAYKGALGRDGALNRMRSEIGYALGVEIDYHALVRMTAFNALTDNVGGYSLSNPTAIKDKMYWDSPLKPRGIYFPSGGTALKGNNTVLCRGWYFTGQMTKSGAKCDRAIVYVRSRKGVGNSDFKRTRRAQNVVAAAISKVVARGSGGNLSSLLSAATSHRNAGAINTNIPMTAGGALEFYGLLNGARLTQQAVFQPTTYASRITGTSSYQLKLTAVRNLTKLWFAPVK